MYFVTGAGGFIGSHLVERLVARGERVRALVHYNSRLDWGHLSSLRTQCPPQLEVVAGDVTDAGQMQRLMEGCHTVYHLAALIGIPYSYHAPASYVAANIGGTLNILEAARALKVRRVIVTSTSEIYGTARYVPMDEQHPLQGQSPYSASKISADKLAESYFCSFDLPVVTLRPFNTYGPRQSTRAIIPTILTQLLSGAAELKLGDLRPRRDLTFINDTVNAFLLAGERPNLEGRVIHFGQGSAVSIRELAELCLQVTGSKAQIVTDEARVRPQRSEVGELVCNWTLAQQLLGWSPTVPLAEGLRLSATYLRQHLNEYKSLGYAV